MRSRYWRSGSPFGFQRSDSVDLTSRPRPRVSDPFHGILGLGALTTILVQDAISLHLSATPVKTLTLKVRGVNARALQHVASDCRHGGATGCGLTPGASAVGLPPPTKRAPPARPSPALRPRLDPLPRSYSGTGGRRRLLASYDVSLRAASATGAHPSQRSLWPHVPGDSTGGHAHLRHRLAYHAASLQDHQSSVRAACNFFHVDFQLTGPETTPRSEVDISTSSSARQEVSHTPTRGATLSTSNTTSRCRAAPWPRSCESTVSCWKKNGTVWSTRQERTVECTISSPPSLE